MDSSPVATDLGFVRDTRATTYARVSGFVRSHPLWAIFLLALGVRLFIALVLTEYFSGTLVMDDSTYHFMAAQKVNGETAGWDEHTHRLFGSTATFMIPITFLYGIFGPHPLVGQLFVALAGSMSAVFVARMAMEFLDIKWALVAGSIVALLPSQAFWSSMLMKDAVVWFVLSGLALLTIVGLRSTGRRLVMIGVGVAVFVFLLAFLRLHTLVVASWALMIASLFGIAQQRIPRIAGAVAIAVAVPWIFGSVGPAGLSLITNAGSLEDRRFNNAIGASSAVVDTSGLPPSLGVPPEVLVEANELSRGAEVLESQVASLSSQAADAEAAKKPARAMQLRQKATLLMERTETLRTRAATLVSESQGQVPTDAGPLDPNLAHLPRGISVMLVEPLPIPFTGSISLRLARVESMIWYSILIVALIGLWHARVHWRRMIFVILTGGGILVMYALTEGNIGTAHRHRGEFVWVAGLLAAMGLAHIVERRRADNSEAA